MEKIKIELNDIGKRLDKVLLKDNISRSTIQKLIDAGKILVNGNKVKHNYTVKENDIIEADFNLDEEIVLKKEDMDLDICYEDEYLLVVNKPSGLVVHPAPGHKEGTLVNGLLGRLNAFKQDNIRPGIVHRIDKDTSGLLMIAKNTEIHEKLAEELKKRKALRKYIALVSGIIKEDTGTIDAPIGRSNKDRKKMMVTDINAKDAITHFKVLERYKDTTLLECTLETGRTHQIRVHMEYIGHPIVNDNVYGRGKVVNNYGQLLHASTLAFNHPVTNEYLQFNAPLPLEFEKILDEYKSR